MELFNEHHETIDYLIFLINRKKYILEDIKLIEMNDIKQGIKTKFYINKLKMELKEIENEYNKSSSQINKFLQKLNDNYQKI